MVKKVLVVLCLLCVVGVVPAMATTADSTSWAGSWEGTTLPYASGQFTDYWFDGAPKLDYEAAHMSLSDPLDIATGSATSGALWYSIATPVTFNFTTGASVEWRIQNHYGTANSGQVFVNIDTGSEHIVMNHVYPDANPTGMVNFLDQSMPFSMAHNTEGGNSFHTFRLTALGSVASLYIDDNPVAALTTAVGAGVGYGTTTGLEWGDKLMQCDFDYLRWTTDGAYAPIVPEPATMVLLAVGGLLLRKKR